MALTVTLFLIIVLVGVAALCAWAFLHDGGFRYYEAAVAERLEEELGTTAVIPAALFGEIEREIPNLKEVIIVAHRVEDPQDQLRDAVEDNFQEGVCYTFLVSASQYQSSADAYTEFFRAIHTIAKKLAPATGPKSSIHLTSFESMFSIRALRGEWGAWPYVFYRYDDRRHSTSRVMAFRGDQMKEGIAEHYMRLSAEDSQSIFNACAMAVRDESAALRLVTIGEDTDFQDASVIVLEEHRRAM